MNQMLIINVLVWERRLEIQREKQQRIDAPRYEVSIPRRKPKKLPGVFGWNNPKEACELS